MERYGLIGKPLGHSFSQKYFTEKFQRENIDALYAPYQLDSAEEILNVVRQQENVCGLNVTIPYKKDVIQFLDAMDDEARAIGAVNVVAVRRDATGRMTLIGHNSDVNGFTNSIKPLLKPSDRKALILGTGGASKAVVYGLEKKLGLEVKFVSRHPQEGQLRYEDLDEALMSEYHVIVNATPLGMFPKVDECPDIPYQFLTPDHVCFDLVYNPLETLFLKKAAQQGARVKNGLEMLHLQADESWEFWQKNK